MDNPRILAETPRILVVDEFADSDEIAHVVALSSDLRAIHGRGIETKHDETGFSFEMPIEGDEVLRRLVDRTETLLGMRNAFGGTLRFRRYGEGDGHPPHLDCFQADDLHLVVTALLYLNETEEGGATVFPQALPKPVEVLPKAGRLVAWTNYTADGNPDSASFHEGAGVRRGYKSTLTNFIYQPLSVCADLPLLGASTTEA